MIDTQKIKKLIKENGKSIKGLASEIGLSNQQLHNIFNGGSTSVDTLYKISKGLNTPICEFFDTPQHPALSGQSDNLRLEMLEKEIEHLKRELVSKDKIIKLLEKKL